VFGLAAKVLALASAVVNAEALVFLKIEGIYETPCKC
jgi:hypothetical protein